MITRLITKTILIIVVCLMSSGGTLLDSFDSMDIITLRVLIRIISVPLLNKIIVVVVCASTYRGISVTPGRSIITHDFLPTEATKAIIRYGFENINLHKVQICTKSINKPSKRVIEKCGFTYEGTARKGHLSEI